MSKFSQIMTKIVGGAASSFVRFPAAMISALVIAVSASYLILLDSVSYNKFYQSLQLGFLLAAVLAMAVAVVGISRRKAPVRFTILNLLTLVAGGLLFWLINSQAGEIPEMTVARVFAGAAILFLLFLVLISRPASGCDYNQASFMTLKSAMIALLYALVILLGSYFIAFSVQSLLYENMSEKVYMHIGVWSAFLWFAFFLGYFPDFSPEVSDPHLETAKKQPRFIEVLFLYVLIPIIAALTVVLLIWVIQILIVGKWPEFEQLTTIFSGYAILGIWLFIMVSNQDKPIARLFRRIYPIVLIVFLAFEAYAIAERVMAVSFQTGEYVVSLIWIYALLSALVLLIRPIIRNRLTAFVAMLLIAVAVMPIIGYQDFTIASQSRRLFNTLNRNQMIVDDRIQPSSSANVSDEDKRTITNAAGFLLYQDVDSVAPWFDNSITDYSQFYSVFGFAEEYEWEQPFDDQPRTLDMYLFLPQGVVDLTGYQYAANVSEMDNQNTIEIQGKGGIYSISPARLETISGSTLSVKKDGLMVIEINVLPFIEALGTKYEGVNSKGNPVVTFEDMILKAEKDNLRIMVVFQSIQATETASGRLQYTAFINSVYLGE